MAKIDPMSEQRIVRFEVAASANRRIAVIVIAALAAIAAGAGQLLAAERGSPSVNTTDPIRAIYDTLSPPAKALYYEQSEKLTKPVPRRLIELDRLTIGCFPAASVLRMPINDKNLGGQCCGVLKDIKAYDVQLKALDRFIKKHGNHPLIPRDPYDVSVARAQQLIGFDRSLSLSAAQQQTYDQAVKQSHHGGPCCCPCWKWSMMAGLGKKFIVERGWTAAQLAELWDTSSSCGHADDTNMHEHYKRT